MEIYLAGDGSLLALPALNTSSIWTDETGLSAGMSIHYDNVSACPVVSTLFAARNRMN
jgi:hypothetical protein